jgi:hypothetical protein
MHTYLSTEKIKNGEETMAQIKKRNLDTGDRFPELTLNFVERGSLTLPDEIKGSWTVLLIYRGHW